MNQLVRNAPLVGQVASFAITAKKVYKSTSFGGACMTACNLDNAKLGNLFLLRLTDVFKMFTTYYANIKTSSQEVFICALR